LCQAEPHETIDLKFRKIFLIGGIGLYMDENTILKQSDTLVSCEIGERIASLNVESGKYHSFNDVASRIWQLAEVPVSVSQICTILVAEYNIKPNQCEKEVLSFLSTLEKDNLVVIQD
jgi:hypothetical protein